MSISLKTHKMIWGRSGNMCAFPDCKKVLVIDETLTDDPSIVGEEAHIVGQKIDGPRGEHDLPLESRDKYDNLILLCNIHHKLVDDQVNEYTVTKLQKYKKVHEDWVKNNLTIDAKKVKEDELYATYIERFIFLTNLHNWTNWTSFAFGSTESFRKEQYDLLCEVPNYVVSRIWPKRYPKLEIAFMNFKNIVNDLNRVFWIHGEEQHQSYITQKFYRNYYREAYRDPNDYSYEAEEKALEKYQYHLALIEDLLLEATRALNYICDFIREYIFEGFRLDEGAIMVMRGDFLGHSTYRVEYRGEERNDHPYPGLRDFMEIRNTRDFSIGTGIDEDYFKKMPWEE